jgi:hypothetical protein
MTSRIRRRLRAPRSIPALASVAGLIASCVSPRAAAPPPHAASESAAASHHGRFRGAVAALADKLETRYVIHGVGARYAAELRANLARGAYDALDDADEVARRLTSDLQAVAPDGHLRVVTEANLTPDGHLRSPDGHPPPAARAEGPRGAPADLRGAPGVRGPRPRVGPPRAPAIGDMAWLADGVAYIQFNEFPGDPETVAALDRFMADHASARALIIDARSHHGGGQAEMAVMLPYLYAKETPLVDMEVAAGVEPIHGDRRGPPPAPRSDVHARPPQDAPDSMRSVPAPPGLERREQVVTPHPTEHRLFTAQVFYLTSRRTFSAAEHLAFAFKRTGRAVLIGEPTGGGNHFGGWESLGDDLAAFIPIGRTIDPVTGADWEGVGVAPDVAVPAAHALDEAVRRAAHR